MPYLVRCCTAAGLAALCSLQPITSANADSDRIGLALEGSILASVETKSPAECKAQCQGVVGCTGYNFILDGIGGQIILGGQSDENSLLNGKREPIANCTLLSGQVRYVAGDGLQSCAMPCVDTEVTAVPQGAIVEPKGKGELESLDPAKQNPNLKLPNGVTDTGSELEKSTIKDGELTVQDSKPGRDIKTDDVALAVPDTPPAPPAPEPTPADPTPAVAAPASSPVRISGYEIIPGPDVTIPPLGVVDAVAECTPGKVPISGGYVMTARDHGARFGLEIKGVMPDGAGGSFVKTKFRNANTLETATGHAIAVCIDPLAAMHNVDVRNTNDARCADDEVIIGGGTWANFAQHLGSTGPIDRHWSAVVYDAFAAHDAYAVRAICVQQGSVEGHEIRESAWQGLSARGIATLALRCTAGKVALSGGFSGRSGNNSNNLHIFGTLVPGADRASWSAELRNRDIFGAPDSVQGRIMIVCATAQ